MNMGRLRKCVLASLAVIGLAGVIVIPAYAASPLFYDGEVTWAVGRRDTRESTDFNYSIYEESMPYFGSVGRIRSELCGIPSNRTTNTYSTFPAFISVKSKELRANGGYLYVGFMLAYSTSSSAYSAAYFTPSQIVCKLDVSGSLTHAMSSGYNLTVSQMTNVSGANTAMSVEYPYTYDIFDLNVRGATHYSGSNFPKKAYMLEGGQITDDFGLGYTTIYEFGDTSNTWVKLNYCQFRVYVEANTGSLNDTVWINLTNAITGAFKSISSSCDVLYGDTLYENVSCYITNPIYLCPVFAYATSSDNYEAIEYYLKTINNNVSALLSVYGAPSSDQQAWMDQYNAYVNQQKQYASSAANAMNYSFTSPDSGNLDVSSYVDAQAKSRFSGVLSLIFSHSKIGAILILSATCAIIGYIFFGKRSQS